MSSLIRAVLDFYSPEVLFGFALIAVVLFTCATAVWLTRDYSQRSRVSPNRRQGKR